MHRQMVIPSFLSLIFDQLITFSYSIDLKSLFSGDADRKRYTKREMETEISPIQQYYCIPFLGAMRHQTQRLQNEQEQYSIEIRNFLRQFKTLPCDHPEYPHIREYCQYYHTTQDKRRNPYFGHTLLYYPSDICNCGDYDCKNSHNLFQRCYHPFVYKTSTCINNCNYSYSNNLCLICPYMHNYEFPRLQKHQFFRFDLITFKTDQCHINHNNNNEYASCRFYHGEGDRRRYPLKPQSQGEDRKYVYSYVACSVRDGCGDEKCIWAHNKIEQLYHPQRYKTKYCSKVIRIKEQNPPQPMRCEYMEFCSFAHRDEELTIELLHKQDASSKLFDAWKLKTVWCPYTENHDRTNCVYAHNFNDFRRDPQKFFYEPVDCLDWFKNKTIQSLDYCGCEKKMNCEKSHGWYQSKNHPKTIFGKLTPQGDCAEKQNFQRKNREEELGKGAPFYRPEQKKKEDRPVQQMKAIISNPPQYEEQKRRNDQSKELSQVVEKQSSRMIQEVPKERQEEKPTDNEGITHRKDQSREQLKQQDIQERCYENNMKEQLKEQEKKEKQHSSNEKKRSSKSLWLLDDELIWKSLSPKKIQDQTQPQAQRQDQMPPPKYYKPSHSLKKSRSKSKLELSYSTSFKKFLSLFNLDKKISGRDVPQRKLINFSEKDIEDMVDLSPLQRNNLRQCLREYLTDKKLTSLQYSKSLVRFFNGQHCIGILDKMRKQKIPQPKLVSMSPRSIQELSFLGESEKEKLPVILENYCDDHAFRNINLSIQQQTQNET